MAVNPWDGERTDGAEEVAGAREGAATFGPPCCLGAAGQPGAIGPTSRKDHPDPKQLKFRQVPGPKGCTPGLPRPPQKRKRSKNSFG